jgi:hypothetical protein
MTSEQVMWEQVMWERNRSSPGLSHQSADFPG